LPGPSAPHPSISVKGSRTTFPKQQFCFGQQAAKVALQGVPDAECRHWPGERDGGIGEHALASHARRKRPTSNTPPTQKKRRKMRHSNGSRGGRGAGRW
jgi:hypothetical protein